MTVTAVNTISGIASNDWIKAESQGLNMWTQVDTVVGNTITLKSLYPGVSTSEKAVRTQGVYSVVTAANPLAVPMNSNVWALGKRADNGSSIARIYLRGAGGGEIEQGESVEIDDGMSQELFTFIGSTGDSDSSPNYFYLPSLLAPYQFSQGDNLVRAISTSLS